MKKTLLAILFFQVINLAHSQNPIPDSETYLIESAVLNEKRAVWIALPKYYDSTKHYPTIYVLDAELQFDIAFSIMNELTAERKIPAHIVVGIPNIDTEHRIKDLTFTPTEIASNGKPDSIASTYFNEKNTGGGWAFHKHLSEEVVPLIDSLFPTTGFNILIGHSLSGYFGAYVLTKVNPFNAFQLYDPSIWYNNADAIGYVDENIAEKTSINVFISTANGGDNRQQYNVDTHKQFHEMLIRNEVSSELKVYDDESHGSVVIPSLIDGLTILYELKQAGK